MIDERFPNWEINIEKGEIYSLRLKKYIGSVDKNGYVYVTKQKGYKYCRLHQYIWMCVNGEIPEGYEIHHIDGNKLNNSIYNLELVEHKKHMIEHKKGVSLSEEHRRKLSNANVNNPKQHPKSIAQYTLDGELIKKWISARQIERELGFYHSNIVKCCKGCCNHSYGFIWKYVEEKGVA